jgi:hypothetical protein
MATIGLWLVALGIAALACESTLVAALLFLAAGWLLS